MAVLGTQEGLDRAPLVHRPVPFGDLIERQREIEHLAWVDRAVEDETDQIRQIAAHRCGATEQPHVSEEQVRTVEHHAVWHPDVADRSARTRDSEGLLHRFLRPYAFKYRVRTD